MWCFAEGVGLMVGASTGALGKEDGRGYRRRISWFLTYSSAFYLLIMAARGRIREIYELSHNRFDYLTPKGRGGGGGCQL